MGVYCQTVGEKKLEIKKLLHHCYIPQFPCANDALSLHVYTLFYFIFFYHSQLSLMQTPLRLAPSMCLSSRDVRPIESQLKGAKERQHTTLAVQCGKVSIRRVDCIFFFFWVIFFLNVSVYKQLMALFLVDFYSGHSIIFARFAPCLLFELNILLP